MGLIRDRNLKLSPGVARNPTMKLQKTLGGALLVSLTLALSLPSAAEPPVEIGILVPESLQPGVDPADLDKTVDPCEDFFRYSCGTWLKANPIPAEYPSWGRFNELQERNIARSSTASSRRRRRTGSRLRPARDR